MPIDVNTVLDATNRGLAAIPRDNLKTAVDEAYLAVGGLGPEISRLVDGSTNLAIDARADLDPLTTLIDQSKPILDSQTDSGGSIQAWASNLASITDQLQSQDAAVAGILENGPGAVDEVRSLFDRLQPTLPIVLANLASIGEVAVAYQPSLEQLLVLLPQGTATTQAIGVAKADTKQDYMGDYLTLNLNLNLPPPCTTGFIPTQQQRDAEPAGLSGPTARRRVLPRPAGRAVQCPRRAQSAVRDRPGQARADREDVRERRELRPAQRRLQLEGRSERHLVRPAHSAASARYSARGALPPPAPVPRSLLPNTTLRQAHTSDRTERCTPSPTWAATPPIRHGSPCWCRRADNRLSPSRRLRLPNVGYPHAVARRRVRQAHTRRSRVEPRNPRVEPDTFPLRPSRRVPGVAARGGRAARDPRGDEGNLLVVEVAEQAVEPTGMQLDVAVDECDQRRLDRAVAGVARRPGPALWRSRTTVAPRTPVIGCSEPSSTKTTPAVSVQCRRMS